MVRVLGVRFTGPLMGHAIGFAEELAALGYGVHGSGFKKQLQLAANVSRWLAKCGWELDALASPEVVEAFFVARREAGYASLRTARALTPLLEHLRSLGLVPDAPGPALTPAEMVLQRFRQYLSRERGLAAMTVDGYVRAASPFVERHEAKVGGLAFVSSGDVSEFVVRVCSGVSRGMARWTTNGLRALLSFLHVEGTLARSLVAAVPGAASWRLVGLPRGLEASEVQLVWASFDRRTNVGRRDFAIFLLLLRLGLRAGEVADLRLEDIDWRAGTLIVRGKGARHERIPLPHDVGAALVSYLRHARPASALDRSVFVRMRAPHRGASSAVVKHAMAAAGRRAGLAKRVGAHRLRHTVATALVAAGSPLPEVAQLLRHRSLQSTSIYAKVDLEALRSLARPWPAECA